jgi:hypothetical protein
MVNISSCWEVHNRVYLPDFTLVAPAVPLVIAIEPTDRGNRYFEICKTISCIKILYSSKTLHHVSFNSDK